MLSKSSLAIFLSKLKVFSNPNNKLEQYPTDSEIAADILNNAYILGDIDNKDIADLGCGTGILGIGALLSGAKHVSFFDTDEDALRICEENLKSAKENFEGSESGTNHYILEKKDITEIDRACDIVIQNPPFGVKDRHADRAFLKTAMRIAPTIISIHMAKSEGFLKKNIIKQGFLITHTWRYHMPLKRSYSFHTAKIRRIEVIAIRAVKNKDF